MSIEQVGKAVSVAVDQVMSFTTPRPVIPVSMTHKTGEKVFVLVMDEQTHDEMLSKLNGQANTALDFIELMRKEPCGN